VQKKEVEKANGFTENSLGFQKRLLEWYQIHHRKLPFRETHEPYDIWISEIMLQQTQMDTVLPYYQRFMKAFPKISDLAEAEEEQLLKLWEGLGYYSRTRNILKCAKIIVSEHAGKFPETYKTLLKLPGIGPYTAGAILSIAFNQKAPAVDGNVMRVFSRLFYMEQDISIQKNRKIFEEKVTETIPENARDYNQALMELGALICLPKKPKCEICPVKEDCKAFSLSIQSLLPVKMKKGTHEKVHIAVGIIRKGETILLTKTDSGLLKGMWGFPVAEDKNRLLAKEKLINHLNTQFSPVISEITEIGENIHVFTHKTWLMTLYEIRLHDTLLETDTTLSYGSPEKAAQSTWTTLNEIENYAMATAFKKILNQLNNVTQKRLLF